MYVYRQETKRAAAAILRNNIVRIVVNYRLDQFADQTDRVRSDRRV